MKQFNTCCLVMSAALLFLTASCGSSGDKKTSPDTTAVSTDNTSDGTPVNTIVTTPESMVTVRHRVADFAKWKTVYDADDSARLANGLHSYVIGRGLEDSNMVMVAMKADDLAKAKAFSQSEALKKKMKEAGVSSAPEISFVTVTWQDTANIGAVPRTLTTFTVKDWDAWLKEFQSATAERLENGLAGRLVSHDAEDNKKVSLVSALVDTAKAFAYYKSDLLKKRIAAAGLTTEPKRFLFRIVARY